MLFMLFTRRAVVCLCWVFAFVIPSVVSGQTNIYRTNGTEYAIVGSLPGDQVFPDAAVTPTGGFVVWQDNATDGSGWGVSARRLDSTLSGTLGTFPVNAQGLNDQENARVASLKDGGAVFVWQGGQKGFQQIYARFLTSSNLWATTNDVLINTPPATNVTYGYIYTTNLTQVITTNWSSHPPPRHISSYTTNTTPTVTTTITTNTTISGTFRINPAVAVLNNSNVVTVWSSYNQAGPGSLQDVYGQILSPTGQKIGGEFLINQFISYNQRAPAVAATKNGGFVVAWVSEQERSVFNSNNIDNTNGAAPNLIGSSSVDIYARLYDSNGTAQVSELLVNAGVNPCANPAVAVASDGSFMVTWCARDMNNPDNSWDIYARTFSSSGVGGTTVLVNTHLYGDQYLPKISAIGLDYLIVWTSLGQDGSREGVFGQFVHEDGSLVGGEFLVNTTTTGQQMQPVVASDGVQQFLVIWTGFTYSPSSFDLFAQRYINVAAVLQPMSAPFVYAPFVLSNGLYQPQLQVSWSALAQQGIAVSNYEVYVDGAATPMVLTAGNVWSMTATNGLAASSVHSFQLDYVTTDGRRPPQLSPSASGKTWSGNYVGTPANAIPSEWMTMYFGPAQYLWPATTADSDGDGMNNYQEFLSGTIPTNSASVLRVQISPAPAKPQFGQTLSGMNLSWNTQPGLTYQVQVTTNFVSWSNLPPPNDTPRFAAGTSDLIFVGSDSAAYYRVLLLRQ